jgi:purine catabolism regulator
MRISDMLDLALFRDAGYEVVAGEDLLDREVRWVHTGEIADIAQFLSGGEVLLTAATGLQQDEKSQRRYIRELSEVGAAAVVIELGRGMKRISLSMIEEARKGGLVLIALKGEVPFVAVTHTIHTQLISSAHASVVRAMQIDDALSQLILDGAPLPAVLELLSSRLRNPVILEDASHRVVAYGRASGSFAPVLRAWQAHSRSAHEPVAGVSVHIAEAKQRCAWCEITLRGEAWGRLHVLEIDSPLDDLVRLALGRAAHTIALHLMVERDAHLSDEAELSLVRGLAAGRDFNGQDFIDRAAGLGLSLDGDLVALATSPPRTDRQPDDLEEPIARLVHAVREALPAARWSGVVGELDGTVVVVAEADTEHPGGYQEAAAAVADRLAQAGVSSGCVGVSRPCRPSALPRAFQESRAAHRLAPVNGEARVQFYDDLALHRLLAPLMPGPELATFVEGELGDLIAYDADHKSDLLRTLDAYLFANGNKIATAESLFLRRRSVYYRLERIEQVLGCSLDSADRRARLYLALRARELLEDRPARAS